MTRFTLVVALLLFGIVSLSAQQSSTKITFFVEHQVEEDKDYLELVLQIKAQDTSLQQALVDAEDTVRYIRDLVQQYCKTNSKKPAECQQITQSGKFNVEPVYRLIRKQPHFVQFAVSYQVTAKILQTQKVGQLIDKTNRRPGIQILSLEWKAFDENDEEIATVGEGLEQAAKRCKNLGLALGEIENIEEVADFQLQQAEGEEQQQGQEEQQDEAQVILYKFVVQCVGKPTKSKTK